jgi:hypothetical protein
LIEIFIEKALELFFSGRSEGKDFVVGIVLREK